MAKGKDPECLMYDCPHKQELSVITDELAEEKKKNDADIDIPGLEEYDD